MYLIYQRGKVASQTIEWSIRLSDPDARIERHHHLSDQVLNESERLCRLEANRPNGVSKEYLASERHQLLIAQQVRDAILTYERPIFLLSGFRDPIDVAISSFFQNIAEFCPWLRFPIEDLRFDTDRTMEVFAFEFNRVLQRAAEGVAADTLSELSLNLKLESFDQWFDRELLGVLGIDVFNYEIGTAPIVELQEGQTIVLLYRMETLRDCLPDLLRKLPLRGEPVIKNENISSKKEYGRLYTNFRSRFIPSAAMMEYYYGGKYFAHFYAGSRPLYSIPPEER